MRKRCNCVCKYELHAANSTRIKTYSTLTMTLNFSLRREFLWSFIAADVEVPIIGISFLSYYNLCINPQNKTIRDSTTNLSTIGSNANTQVASIKALIRDSRYHQVLAQYPELMRPAVFKRETVKHNTVHHIQATLGLQCIASPADWPRTD